MEQPTTPAQSEPELIPVEVHSFVPDNSYIEPAVREERNEKMLAHLRECAMRRYINRYAAYKQWVEQKENTSGTQSDGQDNTVHGGGSEETGDPTDPRRENENPGTEHN